MIYIRRYNDDKGMNGPDIMTTFRTMVVAGSKITATALSSIMTNLLKDLDIYEQLKNGSTTAFQHESEIVTENVDNLPLLIAVIEEGLRLCLPVALGHRLPE